MLLSFALENYRSYRDRQELNCAAGDELELPENFVVSKAPGPERVLKSIAILGANASGKTNLLEGLHLLIRLVRHGRLDNPFLYPEPFALGPASSGQPTDFEVCFLDHGELFNYELSIHGNEIRREHLEVTLKNGEVERVFDRRRSKNGQTRWNVPWLGKSPRVESHELFLGVEPGPSARSRRATAFLDRTRFSIVSPLGDDSRRPEPVKRIAEDPGFRDWAGVMLAKADTGIVGLQVDGSASWEPGMPPLEYLQQLYAKVRTLRRDARGNNHEFHLRQESRGTLEFLDFLGLWYDLSHSGGVLVVDELDSSLHPHLCRELIQLVHSREFNPKHGQLIFTTHDTTLLDTTLLRRDQFYFVEKESTGESRLYSMADYLATEGESEQKSYLAGRYGAIPVLQEFQD